jgi:hypothetical protein
MRRMFGIICHGIGIIIILFGIIWIYLGVDLGGRLGALGS